MFETKIQKSANFEVKLIISDMKIAVPTRDGCVDDHFGHCAYYTIFDVIEGKITGSSKLASPEGCGCKSGIEADGRLCDAGRKYGTRCKKCP